MKDEEQAIRALTQAGGYLDDAFHATQEAVSIVETREKAEALRKIRNSIRAIRQEVYGFTSTIQDRD